MDTDDSKALFASFLTGVTVVTCLDAEGRLTGMTASAVTPVSLQPPQLLVCVGLQADVLPELRRGRVFNVHLLRREQEALAWAFALPGAIKLARIAELQPAWSTGASGAPELAQCLARLDCRLIADHPGGDHRILVGAVIGGAPATPGAEPLVYFGGRMGGRLVTAES